MINSLFKIGTYIFIWKRFKVQIISLILSILTIWLIDGIYNDLIRIFSLKDNDIQLGLLLIKWLLIVFIVIFNIILFKTKSYNLLDEMEDEKDNLPKNSKEVLDKKDLVSTSDVILKKYKNQK